MDYYLKFSSEDAAKAVLFDGETQKYRNIDTVGVIYKNTGTEEEPVMTALPGWHVNVRLVDEEDGTVLEPYAVEVATPMRVWA
jgi:hypothetical protein